MTCCHAPDSPRPVPESPPEFSRFAASGTFGGPGWFGDGARNRSGGERSGGEWKSTPPGSIRRREIVAAYGPRRVRRVRRVIRKVFLKSRPCYCALQ